MSKHTLELLEALQKARRALSDAAEKVDVAAHVLCRCDDLPRSALENGSLCRFHDGYNDVIRDIQVIDRAIAKATGEP